MIVLALAYVFIYTLGPIWYLLYIEAIILLSQPQYEVMYEGSNTHWLWTLHRMPIGPIDTITIHIFIVFIDCRQFEASNWGERSLFGLKQIEAEVICTGFMEFAKPPEAHVMQPSMMSCCRVYIHQMYCIAAENIYCPLHWSIVVSAGQTCPWVSILGVWPENGAAWIKYRRL